MMRGMRKGKALGISEGKAFGINEEKYKVARNLINLNVSNNIIKSATGLSNEEIKKLK